MTTTALAERQTSVAPLPADIEKVLVEGNLAALKPEQRVAYYNRTCESLGLNPLTTPFDYITLNGKLRLYAKKDATDQLRRRYSVSVTIASREIVDGICVVTARAALPSGRQDESIGAVTVKGLAGEALANAWMKAETKAKRRVTLSLCGLGFLDESEVDSIPHARVVPAQPAARLTEKAGTDTVDTTTGEVVDAAPDGAVRVTGIAGPVSGKTASGRDYTYWDISFSDGRTARTFSRTHAELAGDFCEAGELVRADTKPGKKGGLDLEALATAERQPGDEPTETQPEERDVL
jgi:hypothetical protein